MPNETVYTAYKNIHTAWENDISFSDIYHMIVDWMEVWKPELIHPECAELLDEYGRRCDNDDEMHDLVEDFIYGDCYELLREVFLKK